MAVFVSKGSARGGQLVEAMAANIKIPRLVAVHMNVPTQKEVIPEVKALASELGIDLNLGEEDMSVVVRGPE